MKRETYINGNKTIIDTDFYLELLNKEQENSQLKERIEKAIEYIEKTYIGSILEVHCGEEEEYTEPLLEILKGDKE